MSMRKFIKYFVLRGLVASAFGPVVLALLYMILHHHGVIENLTVNEVCVGIFSLSVLAFIAGGMNAVYQLERLPLMTAILIHGIVLYTSYLITYLLNDWLPWGLAPVMVFTGIFIVGYLVIWIAIYLAIKRSTKKVNDRLKMKQERVE